METGCLNLNGSEAKYSFLKDRNGAWKEFWYTIVPARPEPITNQIKALEAAEKELYKRFNISPDTAAIKRFFSSDLITQYDEIINHKKRQSTDFFMSITEQPPATQVKTALLGMCLSNIQPGSKHRDDKVFSLKTTTGLTHIFIEHMLDEQADANTDSKTQTERIFAYLTKKLAAFDAKLEDCVMRTWIYSPNIDAEYPGIVKARNQLFDTINLTKDTHYIASTGIQGGIGDRFSRVGMDAYAILGINPECVHYIQAPEYLCPTHMYGVAFERATAIDMGPTKFLFISGTASIDKNGDVVHPGNVEKQTDRTLVNIDALLAAAGLSKADLSSIIVYLRDPADYTFVKPHVDRYLPHLPAVFVQAPVCRPGWLVEIEATAAQWQE